MENFTCVAGDLSTLHPASPPMKAVMGFSPLMTLKGNEAGLENGRTASA